MNYGDTGLKTKAFENMLFMIIQHEIGRTHEMGTIGVIPEIFKFIIRICIVCNTLTYSKLHDPFE